MDGLTGPTPPGPAASASGGRSGERSGASAARPELLVLRLGEALHAAGSPAHRIEEGMTLAADRLGIAGSFFSTPTALFASFGEGYERHTLLTRVEPGDTDLDRLDRIHRILDRLATREAAPADIGRLLDAASRQEERYGPAARVAAFALVSAGAARFLAGGWREIAAATLLGLLIGGLSLMARRAPALARVFEPVAAALAAFLAALAAANGLQLEPFTTSLAGLIVLVPGLTLTVAMAELATRHLVSGAARFAGAVVVFFGMAFGVALGTLAASLLAGNIPTALPAPLPPWTQWPAVAAAALGLMVLFRAAPRDYGWIVLAGVVAVESVSLGARWLGPQLGAFAGALAVGVVGNLFGRLRKRPAALVHLPGLILLVPGSLAIRSLSSLLERDVLTGVETAFAASLIAIALATGLLVANVVLPPRQLV